MDNIVFLLSLGTVMLLILSLSLKLGYHLSKNKDQKKVLNGLDVVISFIAMVTSLSGLFIKGA